MSTDIEIGDEMPDSFRDIEQLYGEAFPDEDLLPLVRALLASRDDVLSLSAKIGGRLVGHAVFTMCDIAEGNGDLAKNVALLGPVAVAVALQKQGIGGALIRDGLPRLTVKGTRQVFVLGDPAYYSRFGFRKDSLVAPPYVLPEQWRPAWQSKSLQSEQRMLPSKLSVPRCWQDPLLWS